MDGILKGKKAHSSIITLPVHVFYFLLKIYQRCQKTKLKKEVKRKNLRKP